MEDGKTKDGKTEFIKGTEPRPVGHLRCSSLHGRWTQSFGIKQQCQPAVRVHAQNPAESQAGAWAPTCGALAGAWVHCCENANVALRAHRAGLARRPPAQVLVKVPEAEKKIADWAANPKDGCIC